MIDWVSQIGGKVKRRLDPYFHPATGTPQGGIVSPVLANVYLHYALDLWFEKRIKRACNGEALMRTLQSKYRGYWNYYGVIGNFGSLKTFYYRTERILFKWLNRRSQRLSYNWSGFRDLMKLFLIPAPRITEKYPGRQLKLFV